MYVRPFPDVTGGKWPVSTNGGSQPLWARSSKELFFIDRSGALTGVRVEGRIFVHDWNACEDSGQFVCVVRADVCGRMYDISPDGQRFLVLKQSSLPDRTSAPRSITVVQNWFEELKRASCRRAEHRRQALCADLERSSRDYPFKPPCVYLETS